MILAITAMGQDVRMSLVHVILAIFVCVELKYQNLTTIPLVGFAQEEVFANLGSSQKSVHQVLHNWMLLSVEETIVVSNSGFGVDILKG